MGVDKALLTFRGQTLLARALQTAAAVAGKVVIVGPRERYATYGERCRGCICRLRSAGRHPRGPGATETDLNLVLSVDMPLMTSDFLGWLLRRASQCQRVGDCSRRAGWTATAVRSLSPAAASIGGAGAERGGL